MYLSDLFYYILENEYIFSLVLIWSRRKKCKLIKETQIIFKKENFLFSFQNIDILYKILNVKNLPFSCLWGIFIINYARTA